MEIERKQDQLDALEPATATQLHPDHESVSAKWFDLRTQALQSQIAHEQGEPVRMSPVYYKAIIAILVVLGLWLFT